MGELAIKTLLFSLIMAALMNLSKFLFASAFGRPYLLFIYLRFVPGLMPSLQKLSLFQPLLHFKGHREEFWGSPTFVYTVE